jgi:hypothetical protein
MAWYRDSFTFYQNNGILIGFNSIIFYYLNTLLILRLLIDLNVCFTYDFKLILGPVKVINHIIGAYKGDLKSD